MERLHRTADKLDAEYEILVQLLDRLRDDPSGEHLSITLSQAKRVRRDSTLLVKALAFERDNSPTA